LVKKKWNKIRAFTKKKQTIKVFVVTVRLAK